MDNKIVCWFDDSLHATSSQMLPIQLFQKPYWNIIHLDLFILDFILRVHPALGTTVPWVFSWSLAKSTAMLGSDHWSMLCGMRCPGVELNCNFLAQKLRFLPFVCPLSLSPKYWCSQKSQPRQQRFPNSATTLLQPPSLSNIKGICSYKTKVSSPNRAQYKR